MGRNYANNRLNEKIRQNVYENTIEFLYKINHHRNESVFMPTFVTLKPYIDMENIMFLRTYQNILKEKDFYLPLCNRKTKKQINKRIKMKREPIRHKRLLQELEEIKIQKKYVARHIYLEIQ